MWFRGERRREGIAVGGPQPDRDDAGRIDKTSVSDVYSIVAPLTGVPGTEATSRRYAAVEAEAGPTMVTITLPCSIRRPGRDYRRTITASRYSLGTTIVPSVARLNRAISSSRSDSSAASPLGPTAANDLRVGP